MGRSEIDVVRVDTDEGHKTKIIMKNNEHQLGHS